MSKLYIECNMGAAGDMLMGAFYELLEDKETFLRTMNGLFPEVTVSAVQAETCGIIGTHMNVVINGREELYPDVDPGHVHELPEFDHDHDHHH